MANIFVWYELMTRDQDAAEAFYAEVLGWKIADAGMPDMRYSMLNVGDHPVGGMMTHDEHPFWIGYVGVDDVDAVSAELASAGGVVHRAADDIPGIGRFAVVADPQGAVFVLFKAAVEDGAAPPYMTPGTFAFRELHTTDWKAAFAFYSGLFGWEKGEAMDMGPMGTYQLFDANGLTTGAMYDNPDMPRPMWLYYIATDAIDAAKARIEAAGGSILHGPSEVPGGMWIIQAADPQGAMFALVGPRG